MAAVIESYGLASPKRSSAMAFILPCSSDKTGTPPITRLDGSRASGQYPKVGERRFWRYLRRKKFGDQSAARSGASCITLLASLLVLAAQRTLCVIRRS